MQCGKALVLVGSQSQLSGEKIVERKDVVWWTHGEGTGAALQYSCLENPVDGGAWQAAVFGFAQSWTGLSDFTFTCHFHALEMEMATHSSVLAWRIPGTGEPGGVYGVTQSQTRLKRLSSSRMVDPGEGAEGGRKKGRRVRLQPWMGSWGSEGNSEEAWQNSWRKSEAIPLNYSRWCLVSVTQRMVDLWPPFIHGQLRFLESYLFPVYCLCAAS